MVKVHISRSGHYLYESTGGLIFKWPNIAYVSLPLIRGIHLAKRLHDSDIGK